MFFVRPLKGRGPVQLYFILHPLHFFSCDICYRYETLAVNRKNKGISAGKIVIINDNNKEGNGFSAK